MTFLDFVDKRFDQFGGAFLLLVMLTFLYLTVFRPERRR